jgi:hypothetical protein
MRYSLFAALLVMAIVQASQLLQVEDPPDLPPIYQQNAAACDDDDATVSQRALTHEIRTSLRSAPSHAPAPATQPAPRSTR